MRLLLMVQKSTAPLEICKSNPGVKMGDSQRHLVLAGLLNHQQHYRLRYWCVFFLVASERGAMYLWGEDDVWYFSISQKRNTTKWHSGRVIPSWWSTSVFQRSQHMVCWLTPEQQKNHSLKFVLKFMMEFGEGCLVYLYFFYLLKRSWYSMEEKKHMWIGCIGGVSSWTVFFFTEKELGKPKGQTKT